jgi:hypothetical protein
VVSHISRKTSEIWGTRSLVSGRAKVQDFLFGPWLNQALALRFAALLRLAISSVEYMDSRQPAAPQ